jgi:hypothetical protein
VTRFDVNAISIWHSTSQVPLLLSRSTILQTRQLFQRMRLCCPAAPPMVVHRLPPTLLPEPVTQTSLLASRSRRRRSPTATTPRRGAAATEPGGASLVARWWSGWAYQQDAPRPHPVTPALQPPRLPHGEEPRQDQFQPVQFLGGKSAPHSSHTPHFVSSELWRRLPPLQLATHGR